MNVVPNIPSKPLPLNPFEEKAIAGLNFRAGELAHTINKLKSGTKSSFNVKNIAIKKLESEAKQLQETAKTIRPSLVLTPTAKQEPVTLSKELAANELSLKQAEKNELKEIKSELEDELKAPQYREILLLRSLAEQGLGTFNPTETPEIAAAVHEIDKLFALLQGVELSLSKVRGEIKELQNQLKASPKERVAAAFKNIHAAITRKKVQIQEAVLFRSQKYATAEAQQAASWLLQMKNDLNKQSLLEFTEAYCHLRADPEILDCIAEDKKLNQQRLHLIKAMESKFESTIDKGMSVSAVPSSRRPMPSQVGAKKDFPSIHEFTEQEASSIHLWNARLENFEMCLDTLGRMPLDFITVDGQPLVNTDRSDRSDRIDEVMRVVDLCNQLKAQILERWPQAEELLVEKYVAEIVSLTAIENNHTNVLSNFIHARNLLNPNDSTRIMSDTRKFDKNDPPYQIKFIKTPDDPACSFACKRDFEDKDENEIRDTFTVTSRFVMQMDHPIFLGTITISKAKQPDEKL